MKKIDFGVVYFDQSWLYFLKNKGGHSVGVFNVWSRESLEENFWSTLYYNKVNTNEICSIYYNLKSKEYGNTN